LIRQTLRANYGRLQEVRYSQCLTDRWNSGPGVDGFSVMIPGNPEADRGKCANSAEHNLNYIGLDGEIGCIVNGAGLAMATMDMIKHAGGTPANFLDVGGGASPERIATALKLVLSDTKVRAVLVNIFAGINRCDWVAKGVVQACETVDVKVPLVVRLAGTNVEEGRKILAESGLKLITAETLAEAAEKAVAACQGRLAA